MTVPEFETWLERWDLIAPVSMDDLAHIKAELDKVKAAECMTELVLRGDRVEVIVGVAGPNPCRRWLQVRGAELEPKPGLASALARAAR